MSHRHIAGEGPRPPATSAQPPIGLPRPGDLDDPVLQATYDAVMDLGVRRATISEIARRAGVSRMTVYRRYDDFSRLLAALLTVELTKIVEAVEVGSADLTNARSRLVATSTLVTRAVAAHPLMTRVLSLDPEELLPLVTDRLGSTQRLARAHLVRGIRAGQVEHGGDASVRAGDAELLAFTVLVAAQSFVFSSRIVQAEDVRAHDELERLVDRYLAPDTGPVAGGES